jgi:hypothetical protein
VLDQKQSQQVTLKASRIEEIFHAYLSYFFLDATSLS